MTKTTRTALVTLAAALAAGAAQAADAKKPAADKFYASKCAMCHGKDGRGNEKMLKTFKVEAKALDLLDEESSPAADAAFVKAVLDGKGKKMPSFKAKMDGLDAAELMKHIRGLKDGAKASKP